MYSQMESFVKVYVFLDFVKWSFYRFGYIKMPGIVMDEIHEEGVVNELNGNFTPTKENLVENKKPKKTSPQSPGIAAADFPANEVVDTSIEQLYEYVCDLQSSDQSSSKRSFGSDGEELLHIFTL